MIGAVNPVHSQYALSHVHRYGLTTQAVLGRVLGRAVAGDAARRLLEDLSRARRLHAHSRSGMTYYTERIEELPSEELRERFAILWHCCMSKPRTEPLTRKTLSKILAPAADILGIKHPEISPCVLAEGRLERIVVSPSAPAGRPLDLQRALSALQRLLGKKTFRPYLSLAASGRLALIYLVEDPVQREEMARWLTRHPLVARYDGEDVRALALLGTSAVAIPVRVGRLVTLKRPEKTTAPEGLLSRR